MQIINNNKPWTVRDAKARLSDLLRRARTTPQVIGKHEQMVVVPLKDYEDLKNSKDQIPMGLWMLENSRGINIELELPTREDRPSPFEVE